METLFYLGDIYYFYQMSLALVHQNKNKAADTKTSRPAKPSPHHYENNTNLTMNSHDSIIHLQHAIGNQAIQRLMRSADASKGFDFSKIGIPQSKLNVSLPSDTYEQEADGVAEQVMRMTVPSYTSSAVSNQEERIDRKCSTCKMKKEMENKQEKIEIRRKPSTSSSSEGRYEVTNEINNVSADGGSPLDSSTRNFMESRFGYDFSKVRVFTDTKAGESAAALNANAFTVGSDVYFGKGRYNPSAPEGKSLLAHELTHVMQQQSLSANSRGIPQLQSTEQSISANLAAEKKSETRCGTDRRPRDYYKSRQ